MATTSRISAAAAATATAATGAAAASPTALRQSAAVAFHAGDYERAAATFEQYLRQHQVVVPGCDGDAAVGRLDVLYGYADALAGSGRLQASLEVLAHISQRLAGYAVPLDKLSYISRALLRSVMLGRRRRERKAEADGDRTPVDVGCNRAAATARMAANASSFAADPLSCAICGEVLCAPMTALCGHSCCADCLHGQQQQQQQCRLCGEAFNACKPDVMVQRLVEKWWSPEENRRAAQHLRRSALDEALRSCNLSLDKCPNNFQGLLLRSEVLYWLNHFQSSLADADNALKCRPTSPKAHERRAHALAALGLVEEALIAHCVSAAYYRQQNSPCESSGALQQEVAKLIQLLIVPQASRAPSKNAFTAPSAPYRIQPVAERRRLLRRQRSTVSPSAIDMTTGTEPADILGHTESYHPETLWFIGAMAATAADARASSETASKSGQASSHGCGDNQHFLPHRRKSARICNGRRRTRSELLGSNAALSDIPRPNARFKQLIDRIEVESSLEEHVQTAFAAQLLQVNASLVDVADFDCVLCYRTLWQPVVTPCGHTYCLVCLDRCLDYSTQCPLCKFSFADDDYSMQGVRNSLSRQLVTRFIETAMQRFVPAAYRKRRRQEIEREPFVPIFVCTTAFPYVSCPLFVYEARHRLMIRRAIDGGDRQFGIVPATGAGDGSSDGGKQSAAAGLAYSDYGTMLSIRDCVLLANGRSLLSTVGGQRFRVVKRGERDGYSTAKVQYIYDEPVCKSRLQFVSELHANVFLKAVIWYNSLPEAAQEEIVKSFGAMPMLEANWETVPDGPAWAWYIIALLPLGQQLKLEILASSHLEKRLLAINKTLDYVAAQKQRRSVCVQSCEGVQPCQALDCCQPRPSSSGNLDAAAGVVGHGGGGGGGGGHGGGHGMVQRTTDIIIVEDDDMAAMSRALS